MENQPVQANAQPMSYSIVFSPDKPQVPVPKCVTEYKSKPGDSPGTLQRRLDDATERRKVKKKHYFLSAWYKLLMFRRKSRRDWPVSSCERKR